MAPNPDPVRQNGVLNVRDDANTLVAAFAPFTDAWEIVIEATIPSVAVALAAGTYRIRTMISADCDQEPMINRASEIAEAIVVLNAPGNANTPAAYNEGFRSINGNNVTVRFAVSIEKLNGAEYQRYARGSVTIVVAPQNTKIANFQLLAQRQVIDSANAYVRDPSDFKRVLDWYQDAGIDWVRFSYPWSYAEELAGVLTEPHATKLDAIVADIHARGLKYMVILGAAVPCWASTLPGKDCSTFAGRFDTATALAQPSDWALYEDFVKRFVNRYAPDAIEGDNEPNTDNYAALGVTPAMFVNRMTHLWNGVKLSDHPNTPVCSASLSLADTAYLQQMYDAGLKNVCDVISVHPYDVSLMGGQIFSASVATDLLTTLSPHGYKLNERIVLTGGNLPAPLKSGGVVYYVRDVTATTFGLAATRGGARINLTTAGGGTMTAGWVFKQCDPRTPGSPNDAARMKGSLVQGTHRIHKVMRANGDGAKPIWISEWGITTASTFIIPVDETTKGNFIDAAMRLAAHMPYLEVMGLYTLVEPTGNPSGAGYGSITTTGVKKASYARLKAVLAEL